MIFCYTSTTPISFKSVLYSAKPTEVNTNNGQNDGFKERLADLWKRLRIWEEQERREKELSASDYSNSAIIIVFLVISLVVGFSKQIESPNTVNFCFDASLCFCALLCLGEE